MSGTVLATLDGILDYRIGDIIQINDDSWEIIDREREVIITPVLTTGDKITAITVETATSITRVYKVKYLKINFRKLGFGKRSQI